MLLGVVAVGQMGYVLWRSIQAVADPDGEGLEPKGVLKRIGYAGSALLHTFFAFTAANLAAGAGGDRGSSAEEWTGWFLSLPLGWLLIATTGIGIVGVGLYQIYEAYHSEFKKYLKLCALSDGEHGWIEHGGRFGVAARGVVFHCRGVPRPGGSPDRRARGPEPRRRPVGDSRAAFFGHFLLGVVAVGLVAYGLLMVAVARYRRIAPHDAL